MILRYFFLVLGLAVAGLPSAQAYEVCGSLENAYGPFDYRTSRKQLVVVEKFHFTQSVEMLQGGNTSSIGGDLDYTLRASPNHPRALMSMANLALRSKTDRPRGAGYSIDCYFDRAIRFAPDDGNVYMIYGTYLFKSGAKQKALKEFEIAENYAENNANLHYNLGLVYLDAKEYDKALLHAHKAYDLGFPLAGLKNKLIAAGKWQEEPAKAVTSDAKPSPSPAR
jgi:Tfp pilus assembly protein PilF